VDVVLTETGVPEWLGARSGRMGPEATQKGVDAMKQALKDMWKKVFNPSLGTNDANILDSAAQEGLSITTNDLRFAKDIIRPGFSSEGF
jgi:hypothetical protein